MDTLSPEQRAELATLPDVHSQLVWLLYNGTPGMYAYDLLNFLKLLSKRAIKCFEKYRNFAFLVI